MGNGRATKRRRDGRTTTRPTLHGPAEPKQRTNKGPRLTTGPHNDLGEFITRDAQLLDELGWEKFVTLKRGKSDFHPQVGRIRHRAGRLLDHLRKRGASVVMKSLPVTEAELMAALARGPHKSSHDHADFLQDELGDFINQGQWVVLPVRTLRKHTKVYKLMRISPMGVVPQRNRRPRVIVDYSFFEVNDDTNKLAPQDSMQFGKALERILRSIVNADPKFGPVHLIKVDIADGFYRIWLNATDIPKLAVSIPNLGPTDETLVALPLSLPMGWQQSPAYFCAATETVADMANQRLHQWHKTPPHRLEAPAETPPVDEDAAKRLVSAFTATATPVPLTVPRRKWKRKLLAKFDVFVDDYVGKAQGTTEELRHVRRVLFHTLDDVLRPLSPSDSPYRKEPASVKKLLQGDAHWATRKLILGWILDTVKMTIELPPHRKERLQELLDSISPDQKRISLRKWHQLIGELRSMQIALPGSRGLFSLLQEALRHQQNGRVRITQRVHDCIADFRWLCRELTARPTRLYEIVPQTEPELLGAQDASGLGMGGVWFPLSPHLQQRQIPFLSSDSVPRTEASPLPRKAWTSDGDPLSEAPPLLATNGSDSDASSLQASSLLPVQDTGPVVWRAPFPPEITSKLVSYSNPAGTITNSDLELAAGFTQLDMGAQCFDIRERTIASGSDNTPTVAWTGKGSTTTQGPAAYLLRAQALHQRYHRYHNSSFYIPGKINGMPDDASRLLDLSPAALVSHFNSKYPQASSWRFVQPSDEILSSVHSALLRKRKEPESYLRPPAPTTNTGSDGPSSAKPWSLTHTSLTSRTPSIFSKSLPTSIELENLPHAAGPSSLAPWKAPYAQWGRRSPAWGPSALG